MKQISIIALALLLLGCSKAQDAPLVMDFRQSYEIQERTTGRCATQYHTPNSPHCTPKCEQVRLAHITEVCTWTTHGGAIHHSKQTIVYLCQPVTAAAPSYTGVYDTPITLVRRIAGGYVFEVGDSLETWTTIR